MDVLPTLFRRKLAGFTLGTSAEARRCATIRNIGEVQSMTTTMCPIEGADLNSLRVDLFRPPAFLISDCLPHPSEALQFSRRDTWCGPSLLGCCETRAVARGERPIVSAGPGQIDDFTPLQCRSALGLCRRIGPRIHPSSPPLLDSNPIDDNHHRDRNVYHRLFPGLFELSRTRPLYLRIPTSKIGCPFRR